MHSTFIVDDALENVCDGGLTTVLEYLEETQTINNQIQTLLEDKRKT